LAKTQEIRNIINQYIAGAKTPTHKLKGKTIVAPPTEPASAEQLNRLNGLLQQLSALWIIC
jgi:hypothetical protein